MRNLGEAVDQLRDLIAEIILYRVEIDQSIFDHIVKQAGRDAHVIQTHVRENIGDLERMDQVRLARRSLLPAMVERRKKIRAPDEVNIGTGPVMLDLFYYVFDPDHLDPLNILQSATNAYRY